MNKRCRTSIIACLLGVFCPTLRVRENSVRTAMLLSPGLGSFQKASQTAFRTTLGHLTSIIRMSTWPSTLLFYATRRDEVVFLFCLVHGQWDGVFYGFFPLPPIFASYHWWELDFRGQRLILSETAWKFCKVTLIFKKQSKNWMFWKTDRGTVNIKNYMTVEKPCSKLQSSQVKEATTIIRDLFNRTNNHPLYAKYQKIQGHWITRDTDSLVKGLWKIQSPTSSYTSEKQIGNYRFT